MLHHEISITGKYNMKLEKTVNPPLPPPFNPCAATSRNQTSLSKIQNKHTM